MAFDDTRLPDDVERGALGGPGFRTTIVVLSSGFEQRNQAWQVARGRWDVGYGVQSKDDFMRVVRFFYARRGRLRGFRFKDWTDFELARQNVGTTDATTATFQVFRRYSDGGQNYDRVLNKIVTGTETVWVNGVQITEGAGAGQYQLNDTTGVLTLGSTLAAQTGTAVEVQCEFDVPVRFDVDQLDINAAIFDAGSIPQIPIVEVRVE